MQLNLVKKVKNDSASTTRCMRAIKTDNRPGFFAVRHEPFFDDITMNPWISDRVSAGERPLREKNSNRYKHVPHREKPPQVVAKRNARERRRVQAVNNAFVRLRKAVPIENLR